MVDNAQVLQLNRIVRSYVKVTFLSKIYGAYRRRPPVGLPIGLEGLADGRPIDGLDGLTGLGGLCPIGLVVGLSGLTGRFGGLW